MFVFLFDRGVNMFAMLTGILPFAVEPFNIKQLHQKMLIGEIGPIPSDVSPGKALNFLERILRYKRSSPYNKLNLAIKANSNNLENKRYFFQLLCLHLEITFVCLKQDFFILGSQEKKNNVVSSKGHYSCLLFTGAIKRTLLLHKWSSCAVNENTVMFSMSHAVCYSQAYFPGFAKNSYQNLK